MSCAATMAELMEYEALPVEVRRLAERVLLDRPQPRKAFDWSSIAIPFDSSSVRVLRTVYESQVRLPL